ncbi:lytic transglycosylase domain-containing protein, partial [Frankia sp. KB5]|uniref:lytic transglycosylase domain-containing protein n=1 Tax=Frankia sp. KB5 TaxID=683318 RepID=UPI000A21F9A1
MSRIAAGLCALLLAVPLLAGGVAAGLLGGGADGGKQPAPSQAAAQEIPTGYQRLYVAAASTCPGLPWTVLAAIGKVETDHGRNPDWTSRAGAQGPMQFLPATFAAYRVDGDADGTTDINNPADAVYSAAAYLCASGARNGADIPAALFSYNHDNSYVARVLTQADAYSEPTSSSSVECQLVQSTVQSGSDGFSSAALAAVVYACAQIG